MSRALAVLRPHPHRGDVIAAGALPLAVAAVVIDLRMTQWALGVRFAVVALIVGLVLTMGWLAPLEGATPRPYHSVLLVSGLLALVFVLRLLAEALGSHRPPGAGADFWVFGVSSASAAAAARRFNSGICTLIAAAAAAVSVEALVSWVFRPVGLDTFRWILFALTLVFVSGAVAMRDRWRRHAVQLVNAAGLMGLVLGLSYALTTLVASAGPLRGFGGPPSSLRPSSVGPLFVGQLQAPFGWKLYVLVVSFGLVAYAAADREPGPGYLGAAVLALFAVLVGVPFTGRGSLLFWPLFLLVIGTGMLAIGLRPLRPLPPPPPAEGSTDAPTVPLRPQEGDS